MFAVHKSDYKSFLSVGALFLVLCFLIFCLSKKKKIPYLWFTFSFWLCLAHWSDWFSFHLRPSLGVGSSGARLGGSHGAGDGFDLGSRGGAAAAAAQLHGVGRGDGQLAQVAVPGGSRLQLLVGTLD